MALPDRPALAGLQLPEDLAAEGIGLAIVGDAAVRVDQQEVRPGIGVLKLALPVALGALGSLPAAFAPAAEMLMVTVAAARTNPSITTKTRLRDTEPPAATRKISPQNLISLSGFPSAGALPLLLRKQVY